MLFSVIIPSFNQHDYIEKTFLNLQQLKEEAPKQNISLQYILVDNNSVEPTKSIIEKYRAILDIIKIESDKGQYDAINKGLALVKGEYWTWLNTDDLIDINGFFKIVSILKQSNKIDYIYGAIDYINEDGKLIKHFPSYSVEYKRLISRDPSVSQPGSFFKTAFTNKIGLLEPLRCCFDYEYILRCLKNGAVFYQCEFVAAHFRYYNLSKTGSITPIFIREQLQISEKYGRKWFHFLTGFSYLRLMKHRLFPRR
jgi:glycosyltransferase involved in cell wall biosynthesis